MDVGLKQSIMQSLNITITKLEHQAQVHVHNI
jgi:hypothetical protein